MIGKISLGLLAGASSLFCANAAQAQDFYIGQTLLVGFSYCPANTVEANGQLLAISQYTPLFALIGATYGGNGTSNFAVPNLQGTVPFGWGQGPGQPMYPLGATGGTSQVTLSQTNMPIHIHTGYIVASSAPPTIDNPTGAAPATYATNPKPYLVASPGAAFKAGTAVLDNVGGSQPFDMQDPIIALRYCIVTTGLYPSRP